MTFDAADPLLQPAVGRRPGRILLRRFALLALASPFLLSGLLKAMHLEATADEVRGLTGLEPAVAVAVAVIAVQLAGSALLLAGGRATRLGALLLGAFTVAATLLAHGWWDQAGPDRARDFNAFWEHFAIVGGLALAALSAGRPGAGG